MRRRTLLMALVLIGLAGAAFGFDGNRRGFVLGGGFGLAPESNWSTDAPGDLGQDDNGIGFGISIIIGGSFGEHDLLVYEGNITGWNSDVVHESVTQGYNGPAWYHYYGPTGRSAFTVAGVGMYSFDATEYWRDDNDFGLGFLFGGGFEFTRHWQAGLYFSIGQTTDGYNDYNHHHINLLVSGIAF